ncbi:MAG: hypothetical protein HY236_16885 [Acidobacteria bacterium]|nr:hypothetical protein [Acidobacteriota bacterium]
MPADAFEIECPCCKAFLRVDPETRAVILHEAPEKPPVVEDLREAVQKLKGEEGKREQLFRKQVEAEKSHGRVLEKKFEELLKQAKSEPAGKPGIRDIDLD